MSKSKYTWKVITLSVSTNVHWASNIILYCISLHVFYYLIFHMSWERSLLLGGKPMRIGTVSVSHGYIPQCHASRDRKSLLLALIHLCLYELLSYFNLFWNTKWIKVALNDLSLTTYLVILR